LRRASVRGFRPADFEGFAAIAKNLQPETVSVYLIY
jgi:hypothetical protein